MNKDIKISYKNQINDDNGTYYKERIKINRRLFDYLKNCVTTELSLNLPLKKEYIFTEGYEIFLKKLQLNENNICFLNQTQKRFINIFLKLKLCECNTYLYVTEMNKEHSFMVNMDNEGYNMVDINEYLHEHYLNKDTLEQNQQRFKKWVCEQ